jgi:hypothetical protein
MLCHAQSQLLSAIDVLKLNIYKNMLLQDIWQADHVLAH